MKKRIERASQIAREEGLRGLTRRGLQTLGVHRQLLVQGGVYTAEPDRSDLDFSSEQLGANQLDDYMTMRPDQDREQIRARFESGILCFVARREGRLIASVWCATERIHIDYIGCNILLAPDTAYTYDAYVLPELRRHRVVGQLGGYRRATLREMGRQRGLTFVWSENQTAIRRSLQRGNRWLGRLTRYRIGPFQKFVREECESEGGPLYELEPGLRVTRRSLPDDWQEQERARLATRAGL